MSVGPERQVDPVTADQLRVANLHFDRSPEKDGDTLRTFRFATACAWARRSQFSGAEPLFGAVLPHEKRKKGKSRPACVLNVPPPSRESVEMRV